MDLEEKLHDLARKGELVHLSIVSDGAVYKACFAAASPPNGYSTGVDVDPVRAAMAALEGQRLRRASRAHKPEEPETNDAPHPEGGGTDQDDTVTVKPERTSTLRSYMNP